MASLTCLHPTHPLLLHLGSALPAISNRCFNHSSSLNRTLSAKSPRTVPPRAMTKPSFSPAQDQVASRKFYFTPLIQPFLSFFNFFFSSRGLSVCFFEAGDFEFVPPLRIVEYPDPKLRAKNKRIVTFDDNLKKLVHEMFDLMYK